MSIMGFMNEFDGAIDFLLDNVVYQNCEELHVMIDGVLIKITEKEMKIIE